MARTNADASKQHVTTAAPEAPLKHSASSSGTAEGVVGIATVQVDGQPTIVPTGNGQPGGTSPPAPVSSAGSSK
jgi:hypothetical protein